MPSQDLDTWFAQAAAVAAKVPKNLQEAAFNRALDHLMKGQTGPASGVSTPARKQAAAATVDRTKPQRSLADRIDRTRCPDVGASSRVGDRALKILQLALNEYETDGLSASEIAEILTRTFRLPAAANSVNKALGRERNTVSIRRDSGRTIFSIMQPGEEYLKQLRAGRVERVATGKSASVRRRKPAEARVSQPDHKTRGGAKERSAGAAEKKKRASGRLGPKAAIEKLIENGFFKSSRTIADVREELKHRFGFDFVLQELSISLVRLLREGALNRDRSEKHQYEYHV